MFFSKLKKEAAIRAALNEETSRRFAVKLKKITEINEMITDTIEKTQAANITLLSKLKNHIKSGSQSFISLSEKLNVGVLVVNYLGEIIQGNPKAKEILKCNDIKCVGMNVFDLITSIKRVNPPGDLLLLSREFFKDLSNCIFDSIITCTLDRDECAATGYANCLKKLPCSFHVNEEELVKIESIRLKCEQYMKFTFSILNNNPDELSDITYVIIFHKSKKMR